MKLFKEHVEYLKDNPEGYWFKRKLYGWGWTPATRAGWATTIFFLAFVIFIALGIEDEVQTTEDLMKDIILLVLAFVVFITITIKTGEPLKFKWRWGKEHSEKK